MSFSCSASLLGFWRACGGPIAARKCARLRAAAAREPSQTSVTSSARASRGGCAASAMRSPRAMSMSSASTRFTESPATAMSRSAPCARILRTRAPSRGKHLDLGAGEDAAGLDAPHVAARLAGEGRDTSCTGKRTAPAASSRRRPGRSPAARAASGRCTSRGLAALDHHVAAQGDPGTASGRRPGELELAEGLLRNSRRGPSC